MSAKLHTEISWWMPAGCRVVYQGTPKTRAEWIRLTWRAYIACWHLTLLVAWKTITYREDA